MHLGDFDKDEGSNMSIDMIKENIDVLSKKLNSLIENNYSEGHLISGEILDISKKLDKYIAAYFTHNQNKGINILN